MIVGTADVDHGKTALVRALTGVDTDRLKEEKNAASRSISGSPTCRRTTDDRRLGRRSGPRVRTCLRARLIDFVPLVVAADDGVMSQTREHLAIVDARSYAPLVAMTKVDPVSRERPGIEREIGTCGAARGSRTWDVSLCRP
jgi:selenocysteine-specific elongation factor